MAESQHRSTGSHENPSDSHRDCIPISDPGEARHDEIFGWNHRPSAPPMAMAAKICQSAKLCTTHWLLLVERIPEPGEPHLPR